MTAYTDYLAGGRPFASQVLQSQGITPMSHMLLSSIPSIDRFMRSYGGYQPGGDLFSALPAVSMNESAPYASALRSLFGSGLGNMPEGDVMTPQGFGPDYIQTRLGFI